MADDEGVAVGEALDGAAQVGADGFAQERDVAGAVGVGEVVHGRGLYPAATRFDQTVCRLASGWRVERLAASGG